jgi:hypothetical protein
MIIVTAPPQYTRNSLHAIVTRQMADILAENKADLDDLVACRQMLEGANFGRPALDALLERACAEAGLEVVS